MYLKRSIKKFELKFSFFLKIDRPKKKSIDRIDHEKG